jgi:hypothetical protein
MPLTHFLSTSKVILRGVFFNDLYFEFCDVFNNDKEIAQSAIISIATFAHSTLSPSSVFAHLIPLQESQSHLNGLMTLLIQERRLCSWCNGSAATQVLDVELLGSHSLHLLENRVREEDKSVNVSMMVWYRVKNG